MESSPNRTARTPTSAALHQSKNRQCRNVLIHGHCRFEGKGCQFLHSTSTAVAATTIKDSKHKPGSAAIPILSRPMSSTGSSADTSITTKSPKINVDSPVFTPSRMPATTYTDHPSTSIQPSLYSSQNDYKLVAEDSEFEPFIQQPDHAYQYTDHEQFQHQQYEYNYYEQGNQYSDIQMMQVGMESMGLGSQQRMHDQYQDKASLETYFMHQHDGSPYLPLHYHHYNTPLPNVSHIPPHLKSSHNFFIDDQLREMLLKRNEAVQQVVDPSASDWSNLPQSVDTYHTLFPLDESNAPSKIFGYPTSVYKAIRSTDGKPYVLRRIEGFRMLNEAAMMCIDNWQRVRHANIVSVIEAFTTKAFGDSSLVLVYNYHPLAMTLTSKYFSRHDTHLVRGMDERELWSFICQITSALKTIHMHTLAARAIDPSKVIVTGKNRFSLNCCGVMDMLTFEANSSLAQLQQEDLRNFGKLIVSLAVGSLPALQNIQKCLDHIRKHFSPDLTTVVMYLLGNTPAIKSIDGILQLIASRLLDEMDSAFRYNDRLEDDLSRELENARLVRLMSKLGFINERPEYDLDPTWAETGDVYLLKLFRDYIFHQVDQNGAPLLDLGHVIQTLNKLDVGVDEKIMLTSRDEKSCLVASYRDLKQCIDTTFREMIARRGWQK
ncbi:hypothetical protein BDV3_007295 [Batrachochytrium dendrobatidis]